MFFVLPSRRVLHVDLTRSLGEGRDAPPVSSALGKWIATFPGDLPLAHSKFARLAQANHGVPAQAHFPPFAVDHGPQDPLTEPGLAHETITVRVDTDGKVAELAIGESVSTYTAMRKVRMAAIGPG